MKIFLGRLLLFCIDKLFSKVFTNTGKIAFCLKYTQMESEAKLPWSVEIIYSYKNILLIT